MSIDDARAEERMATTLHIALSATLDRFVRERVEHDAFVDAGDHARSLIEEDHRRHVIDRLEDALALGLEPGAPVPPAAARAEIEAEIARRRVTPA
jgi:Arc/MetJ-type ribon-helix-helix transcriptional regulator